MNFNKFSEDKDKNKNCLIEELGKLKESSMEAVEGLNKFSSFKKYMHVERDVQLKLEELIMESFYSERAQLILVCGSVGDGKSHIISYFKDMYPDIISKFKLHNDATESLEPNQTSMDTLNYVLDEFSDEKIENSKKKLILAINLGTLNNFIDSKYGVRFTKLKNFVEEKKILEQSIVDNNFDENSSIQFVNFCDYHIYTIKNEKIKSKYIKSLLLKITKSSKENYFYSEYENSCLNCKIAKVCPIKANYELLGKEEVQNKIIDLLVQVIIKNKVIISTRALLNFIHDILISRTYIDINSPMFKQKISKLKPEEYINSLMPNVLFSHKELSSIFHGLSTLDPLNIRNEELDDFIIKFNNSTDIFELFDDNLSYVKGFLGNIENDYLKDNKLSEKIKFNLLKLFIRGYLLFGKNDIFSLEDKVYTDFIRDLYYWNKGEKTKLSNLYNFIKSGILKWNGESAEKSINIFLGKSQNKYKISEKIDFKADTKDLPNCEDEELVKFLNTMEIKFKSDDLGSLGAINVDYALYSLLKSINKGYRPNKKDKNKFIKFIEFVNNIEAIGSQNKLLLFTEKNREQNKTYILEYDDEFDTYKFLES